MKQLVIVESPAKANTIKKYLGSGYTVCASLGHIRDLPRSTMGVDLEHNYEPRYITIRGKGEILQNLKRQAKGAGRILLATDPDREGEAISWHLATYLGIDVNDKCRITFNEITKSAVKSAIAAPRAIDMSLVDAQVARRVLDRIVGYTISPILWRKVKKGLSAGRVQSVAIRIIVERAREIEAFTPQEYHTLTATLSHDKQKFTAQFHGSAQGKLELPSTEVAEFVKARIENADISIAQIKRGKKTRTPPPPFITSTLQQDASSRLSYGVARTMSIAQQLYEGVNVKGVGQVGLITYMRTDSLRISDEAWGAVSSFVEQQFGPDYVLRERRGYKQRKGAQDAHEAIRPSDVNLTPAAVQASLTDEQYKLYKLIWERFVASSMQSATYDTVSAEIHAHTKDTATPPEALAQYAHDTYVLRASGSILVFPGFLSVYPDKVKEKDNLLPPLSEGMALKLHKLEDKQHFTEPPPQYTEASLIKKLEEEGIGRPSTYAPTISTIVSRGYIVRSGKALVPTELGFIINDIMVGHFSDVVDLGFTAQMEEQLDDIEAGEVSWVEVIDRFYQPFHTVVEKATAEVGEVDIKDEESDVPCDKCGKLMVYKMGKYGRFLACPGFPDCRNAKPILHYIDRACPVCGERVVKRRSKRGRFFYACEKGEACSFISWDEPNGKVCPTCGAYCVNKSVKGRTIEQCSDKNCSTNKKPSAAKR